MPKLKTLSRFLAPVALVALAACQTPPMTKDSTAPSTAPTTGVEQTQRVDPSAQPLDSQMEGPLMVFLADTNPQTDWVQVEIDTNEFLYMEAEPFLTRRDLASIEAGSSENDDGLLALSLNTEAAARLSRVTELNPGKRLALVVDGTLLAIPGFSEPITEGRLIFMVGTKENAVTAAQIIAGQDAQPMQ